MKMGSVQLVVFLCVINTVRSISNATHENYIDVVNLIDTLLQGYSAFTVPRRNQSETIQVDMEFSLKALNKFDVVDGHLTVVTAIALNWTDDMLRWNPSSNKNISQINLPLSRIWTPNLYLLNCAEEFLVYTGDPATKEVEISSNGEARLFFMEVFTTTCSTDIAFYPNDVHHCKIYLSTLTSARKLRMGLPQVTILDFETNGKWTIKDVQSEVELLGMNIDRVGISVTLERRMMFDIMSIVFPVVFLGLVNVVVFKLPVDSGERMSFAMTVLLSFAVYMTLIADRMPQTSNTTSVFCIYLMAMLTYSTLIVFATTFSINCHHNNSNPVTDCVDRLVQAWMTLRKVNPNDTEAYPIAERKQTIQMKVEPLSKPASNTETSTDDSKNKTDNSDKFFFSFFLLYFIISTFVLFVMILCR